MANTHLDGVYDQADRVSYIPDRRPGWSRPDHSTLYCAICGFVNLAHVLVVELDLMESEWVGKHGGPVLSKHRDISWSGRVVAHNAMMVPEKMVHIPCH